MLSKEQCVWIVMQMSKLENPIMVKNEFKRAFRNEPHIPSETLIRDIFKYFLDTGSILDCSGNQPTSIVPTKKVTSPLGTHNKNQKRQAMTPVLAAPKQTKEKIPPWQTTLAEKNLKRQTSLDKYAAVQEAFKITPSKEIFRMMPNKDSFRMMPTPTGELSRNSSISDLSDCSSVVTVLSRRPSATSTIATSISSVLEGPQISVYEMASESFFLRLRRPLTPEDCDGRLQMCEELRDLILADKKFVDNLVFSDEATFHMSGRVTKHNCTVWGPEYPQDDDKVRDSPKVVVWCGMNREQVFGPFFFTEIDIREESYTNMLRTFLLPLLRRRDRMATAIFQHDGAASHLGPKVRHFLDDKFPKRWLGKRGLVKWAPWAPDLSPIDFYLWGELRSQVFRSKSKSVTELKGKISSAVSSIRIKSIESAFREWQRRVDECLDIKGSLVE